MSTAAADVHTEMAMLWCATFTDADYPRCRQIASDMIDHAASEGLDEPMFAYKSLAQSLHFMGEHAEARRVAERVRREATGYLACTTIHPYVSMGIVLARIACLAGTVDEAVAIAEDTLQRAYRDNPVAKCQTLAMASAPIAIWNGDEDAARRYALRLIDEAEADQLNYWRGWGYNLLRAIDMAFNPDDTGAAGIDIDGLDALVADHLATVDGRTTSQLAQRRVANGLVGWSAPEVMRTQATTTIWYDPAEADRLLFDARRIALQQGAATWVGRIDDTISRLGRHPSGSTRPGSSPHPGA
jgi:hypothetical protein